MKWEQVTLVKFTISGEIPRHLKQALHLAEIVGDRSEEDWKDIGYPGGKTVAHLDLSAFLCRMSSTT